LEAHDRKKKCALFFRHQSAAPFNRARILQTQTPYALRLISVLSQSTPSSPQSQDRLHAHYILPLNINATDAHNAPFNVLVYNGPVSNFCSRKRDYGRRTADGRVCVCNGCG
ncbi:hypothetical protein BJ741DRAFT_653724, partial [Chytriomyces cf. hyalinus JEL632]